MNVAQVLLDWLSPVLDPLGSFQRDARNIMSIHHTAVDQFSQAVTALTAPGANIFKGAAANAFTSSANEYFHSEIILTGAGTQMYIGGLEEAAFACAVLEEELLAAVEQLALELTVEAAKEYISSKIDDIITPILEDALTVVTISAVAQLGLDVPDDVIAGIVASVFVLYELIGHIEEIVTITREIMNFFVSINTSVTKWQRTIQNIAHQSLPSLPSAPVSFNQPVPLTLAHVNLSVSESTLVGQVQQQQVITESVLISAAMPDNIVQIQEQFVELQPVSNLPPPLANPDPLQEEQIELQPIHVPKDFFDMDL